MIDVYGLKTCDTCRKAMQALREAGLQPEFHDVRQDPPAREMLQNWLERFPDALVNRKSTTWRGLDDSERSADPMDLLTRYPALMKRPVIIADGTGHLGWTADVRSALGVE